MLNFKYYIVLIFIYGSVANSSELNQLRRINSLLGTAPVFTITSGGLSSQPLVQTGSIEYYNKFNANLILKEIKKDSSSFIIKRNELNKHSDREEKGATHYVIQTKDLNPRGKNSDRVGPSEYAITSLIFDESLALKPAGRSGFGEFNYLELKDGRINGLTACRMDKKVIKNRSGASSTNKIQRKLGRCVSVTKNLCKEVNGRMSKLFGLGAVLEEVTESCNVCSSAQRIISQSIHSSEGKEKYKLGDLEARSLEAIKGLPQVKSLPKLDSTEDISSYKQKNYLRNKAFQIIRICSNMFSSNEKLRDFSTPKIIKNQEKTNKSIE